MKLFYSQTSPFVRKALMVAHERGLVSRIELSPTDVWSPETVVPTLNPLGKIPTLVTDDGMALFDSPVIAEYLDSQGTQGQPLFPRPGRSAGGPYASRPSPMASATPPSCAGWRACGRRTCAPPTGRSASARP
ncbi:glutathione S-transferase N-terminal domain-containing protein [Nitrospirillum sp. BR 11164]|uniref:glutathione S-transferase N-terminal domain-containing protein n=1 Tax=Nitrospirillum sp. BR 11164 TaxID=3104324 RepID=UPI002AFFB2DA|nr:glutathione S-transferase N-terminal domain-containing protein [Nitrospirillum sp. BR 11164]MEA1650263.1 glutathione S-transferase N-terminal domain-containing protein [Nitrospirillum sp. BR 11164]